MRRIVCGTGRNSEKLRNRPRCWNEVGRFTNEAAVTIIIEASPLSRDTVRFSKTPHSRSHADIERVWRLDALQSASGRAAYLRSRLRP
jgi:hypothetical protein